MSATTTNRGYTYPQSTDAVVPYTHIQALAEDIDADVEAVANQPYGKIGVNVEETLPDDVEEPINFQVDDYDSHNFHNTSSNNTRVTFSVAGTYRVWATVSIKALTTPVFVSAYYKMNGTTVVEPAASAPGFATVFCLHPDTIIQSNGSDYLELYVRQNSAGSNGLRDSVQYTTKLHWQRIAD